MPRASAEYPIADPGHCFESDGLAVMHHDGLHAPLRGRAQPLTLGKIYVHQALPTSLA